MADMTTRNGLTIVKVGDQHGGYHVELRRPAEHDPKGGVFMGLRRIDSGEWQDRARAFMPCSLGSVDI